MGDPVMDFCVNGGARKFNVSKEDAAASCKKAKECVDGKMGRDHRGPPTLEMIKECAKDGFSGADEKAVEEFASEIHQMLERNERERPDSRENSERPPPRDDSE